MNHPMGRAVPEPVLLIIADISGYTRYMTANAKTLAHSHTIIIELIEAIIRQIEMPLEVAKLEGDAVFLYSRKNAAGHNWANTKKLIGEKLLTFFQMFSDKVAELSASTTCTCNACSHIEKLRLKVIVHSGEALFHRVVNFVELAGVDVIAVHRLLKNSVESDQYLLMTEAARNDIEFPTSIQLKESIEKYEELGPIRTLIYLPDAALSAIPVKDESFSQRFVRSRRLYFKLWWSTVAVWNQRAPGHFRNVGGTSGGGSRFGLALLVLVLAPLLVPVGFGLVFFRSFRTEPENIGEKAHPADCRCGQHGPEIIHNS